MARHISHLKGALCALALIFAAALSAPANAALNYCSNVSGLPCLVNTVNQNADASAIPELVVESALSTALGSIVDLTLIDRVDKSFWSYPPEPSTMYGFGSHGLTVAATDFDYVPCGTPPYGGCYYQAVGGSYSYGGSQTISYITVGTYTNFAIYRVSDLLNNNWTTTDLSNFSNKLVHFALWATTQTHIDEPATLGLLLAGTAVLLWRRRRQTKAA